MQLEALYKIVRQGQKLKLNIIFKHFCTMFTKIYWRFILKNGGENNFRKDMGRDLYDEA